MQAKAGKASSTGCRTRASVLCVLCVCWKRGLESCMMDRRCVRVSFEPKSGTQPKFGCLARTDFDELSKTTLRLARYSAGIPTAPLNVGHSLYAW